MQMFCKESLLNMFNAVPEATFSLSHFLTYDKNILQFLEAESFILYILYYIL